jgi:hypothetical protein
MSVYFGLFGELFLCRSCHMKATIFARLHEDAVWDISSEEDF